MFVYICCFVLRFAPMCQKKASKNTNINLWVFSFFTVPCCRNFFPQYLILPGKFYDYDIQYLLKTPVLQAMTGKDCVGPLKIFEILQEAKNKNMFSDQVKGFLPTLNWYT